MIFKKIYTFLNDRLNGNFISKFFLTLNFIITLCIFFLISEARAVVSPADANKVAKSKADKDLATATATATTGVNTPPTCSYISATSGAPTGNQINEFHILYQKTGLNPVKIYTSYLPPKDTYNSNLVDEHSLEYCGVLGQQGDDMIGKSCMIKIPFDCASATRPTGVTASSGVNCLNYSRLFRTYSATGKKLDPIECERSGGTDLTDCLSSQKPYCHTIGDPIIAINCKLAPCNAIPNKKYRRPGVNCLADCNDASRNAISKPEFFLEGFNCLTSCKTKASPKNIGENCVLEFNDYVMPLCNQQSSSTKSFNKAVDPSGARDSCLDVINLPLCSASAPASDELTKCVKQCSQTLTKHNINCINFSAANSVTYNGYVDKSCHHYNDLVSLNSNPGCNKLDCHKLSDTELSSTLNIFDSTIDGFSTRKYCIPTKYTNFSLNQFKAINDASGNAYLRDYKLDDKPCYSDGDTEEIETVLSSDFYKKPSVTYSSKIQYLKSQCTGLLNAGTRTNPLNCTTNRLDITHADYNANFLYDQNSFCTFGSISQQILCTNYKRATPAVAPNDCNSPSLSSCPSGSCPICQAGETYCYKTGINCNSSSNQKYPICSALKNISQPVMPADDEYVSWFFRPTVDSDAIREITGASGTKSYSLINMSGYPVSITSGGTPSDDLYMTNQNLRDNGYIDGFWGTVSGSYILGTGTNMGLGAVGPSNICGMNGDYRNIPTEDFAYFRGGVRTVYGLDDKLSHNVEICVRYRSSTNLMGTCGYRRCYTSCVGFLSGLSPTCSKVCGYDVCKTMSIIEESNGSQTYDCSSSSKNFTRDLVIVNKNSSITPMSCSSTYKTSSDTVSDNTRVRIYKPSESSNYICAVIDFKDITIDLNRNGQYFNGSEYFLVPNPNIKNSFKKLCVSGVYSQTNDACENGVNTNNKYDDSSVWRTARIIKYIMQPSDVNGNWDHANPNSGVNYLDQYGVGPASLMSLHIDNDSGTTVNQTIGRVRYNVKRYFEKSDCIKHESKVGAPIFFPVASISNSHRLFLPPLEIEGSCEIASSPDSNTDCIQASEEGTDFFKPAIKILYGKKGASNSFLSTDPGSLINTNYKLLKITNPALDKSPDYYIKALNIGITTSATIAKTVFIKKEQEDGQPKLCLYEKISLGGTPPTFKESLIKCVNRKRAQNASIDPTTANPPHTHLSFGVKFLKNNAALLSSPIDANLHSSIIDSNLSMVTFNFERLIDLKNTIFLKKCEQITGNGFPICVEREECSALNNECVENEKALIIAKSGANPQYGIIAEKEVVSNYCKAELLSKCNFKKGHDIKTLNTSAEAGEGFNAPAVRNHYGWFNEFCITSGVEVLDDEAKHKYVEALIPTNVDGSINEEIGQCKTMANPSDCSSCDNIICLKHSCCKIYNPATSQLDSTVTMRKATPRELGLCYTITNFLKTCPAISYGRNTDITDAFFVGSSFLGGLSVNPHLSHISRFNSSITKNGVTYNSRNAEFDVAYGGISSVMGKCVGFYRNKILQNNPTANCLADGTWSSFSDSCTLYSCPAKKLDLPENGANFYGNYISTYDSSNTEIKSQAGSQEGYANWNAFTKTGYLKQLETSNLCITGYSQKNSRPITSPINNVDIPSINLVNKLNIFKASRNTREIDALYKKISGFSNGTQPPQRLCNQLGIWETVTNPCERITCPALNFEKPVDYDAFYMNDYNLTQSGDVLYCAISSGIASIRKVKIDTGSFTARYVNAVADSSNIVGNGNNFPIKNSSGTAQNLLPNRTYVLEKIPASGGSSEYWKILDNSNDEVLRALWIKSGGATFPQGYALRSVAFNYNVDPLKDPLDMHRVTGTCNREMGFNPIGASLNPEFVCDSNGNWTFLKNQCTSDCSAVNGQVSLSKGHGFALWGTSRAKVGTSELVSSSQCSTGYLPYPYPPLYDNEGVKGDFGSGATLSSSGSAFSTSDVFDGIASTTDGANFVATPVSGVTLSPVVNNFYNFKIQNQLSGGLQGSGSDVQTSFYLFSNSPLTLTAPSGTIWSKISFASFGTPDYSNSGNFVETPSCNSEYSKFILGTKCIGKATCSISLSDFLGYDTLLSTPCKTPKYGNGTNGEQNNSNNNFGSGGGGGGGNNPGSGGTSASSTLINGMSGTSYYDKAFHLTPPTLAEGGNQGLKVDLTSASTSQFNGASGRVQIEESINNGSTYSVTGNYQVAGEHNHTISSGSANQDIYVRYIMIGGGGGGGGSGLTKGTNGANGAKMERGVFVVKKGTVLKIHVGGGGEAGKTRCRSAGGAFLDPRYINPAIEILEPEKETNFVVKALKGIGSLIVSEGWAQTSCLSYQNLVKVCQYDYSCQGYKSCNGNPGYWYGWGYWCTNKTDNRSFCSLSDLNGQAYGCSSKCVDKICSLSGGVGYAGKSVSGQGSFSCDIVGYTGTVSYTCNIDNATIAASSSYCVENKCRLDAGFGYDAIANASGAEKSITCKTGYQAGSPAPTYTCTTNNINSSATVSGGCIKQCSITAGDGYAAATVIGTGTLTCTGTPYNTTDTVSYSCTSAGVLSWTDQICNCATGYAKKTGSNVCEKQCSITAGDGYPAATVIGTGTLTCTGTPYNTTDTVSYSCTSAGVLSWTDQICNCATGYGKNASGACVAITCTSSGASVGTSNTNLPIGTTGTLNCLSPYSGTATYSCSADTAKTPTPNTGIFSITTSCGCISGYAKNASGECVKQCSITAGDGYAAATVVGTGTLTCTGTPYNTTDTVTYSCSSAGVLSWTDQICNCATGYGKKTGSNVCEKQCSITAGDGYPAATVIGTGTLTCTGTPYNTTDTVTYSCSSAGALSWTDQICNCATGYAKKTGKNVCERQCTISGVGYTSAGPNASSFTGIGSGSFNCFAGFAGIINYICTGTNSATLGVTNGVTDSCTKINCKANSGVTGILVNSIISYSVAEQNIYCNDPLYNNFLTATFPACTSAQGLNSVTGKNYCQKITCAIPASNYVTVASIDATSATRASATSVSLTCQAGYYSNSPVTASCITANSTRADGSSVPNTGSLYISESCKRIKCTVANSAVSGAVDGNSFKYIARSDLDYTGTSTGTFPCNEGYYGDVTYRCNYTTNGQPATILSDSCVRIKCDIPVSANSNLIPNVSGLRIADYSAVNKQYTCGTGYEQAGSYVPSYTCVGNAAKTNPATISVSNACSRIQCIVDGTTYDFGQSTIACSTALGLYGNKVFTCNPDHSVTYSQTCSGVLCKMPDVGGSVQNSAIDGRDVRFTGSTLVPLDCKDGYYYSNCLAGQTVNCGRPQYTCQYDASIVTADKYKYGRLNLYGNRCERITCNLPTTGNYVLNSVLDNDPTDNTPSGVVNWTGNTFVTTSCREGFYMSDPTQPPKYSCFGASQPGIITTNNSCSPVTCDIADRVGMFEKNNLEYGVNKVTSCNKPGYSGQVTYTCGGPVSSSGKGTLSAVSSTCKESSCDRGLNNPQTYDFFVNTVDQIGGAGGKILAGSAFLKGGNGGSASNSGGITSGSGGGGGSASMISIENRIIAIAGGGGGGAGGGMAENTSSAVSKSNSYDLEQTLLSNVFGPYLIAEMQYANINGSNANTAGVLYERNNGNTFSLSAPAGMFIDDIFLASSGNPNINFSDPNNLILKHGSCNNLQGLEEVKKCLGKESCSFTVDQNLSCPSVAPNFGVVASYYFQEPTLSLKINPPSGNILINSPRIKIKQLDSSNTNLIAANNLRNDTVYTFIYLKNDNWGKYNYLSDEYYIQENPPSNNIRVRFHRANTTFSPKLKIGSVSLEIKKDTGGPLTLGYIKTNIDYILRKKFIDGVEYWTIRPYIPQTSSQIGQAQREAPKRTCMTNLFSAGGAVNVIWSQPNSYCVNSCPSFEDDNRIGVGATQHTLSNNVTAIAKWEGGTFGQYSIQRFSGATVNNSEEDGGGLAFSRDPNSFDINVFRSDDQTNKFILARYCNIDGTWSDPISLCEITTTDSSKAPVVNATSYINPNSSNWVNANFMVANGSDTATSSCLIGYGLDFRGDLIKPGEEGNYYPSMKYRCLLPWGGRVDQAYFEKVPDPDRRECIKSCRVGDFTNRQGSKPASIDFDNKVNYKIKNNVRIELQCASGYLPPKINGARSSLSPAITCDTSGTWNSGIIENECTQADKCYVSSLTKLVGSFTRDKNVLVANCWRSENDYYENGNNDMMKLKIDYDTDECPSDTYTYKSGTEDINSDNSDWFPAIKFIDSTHRNNGMNHGEKQTFVPVPNNSVKKYGKCGYCTYNYGTFNEYRGYRRKYLQSYSCNDGTWSFDWYQHDLDNGKACDNDPWDWYNQGLDNHPNKSYLNGCEGSNKDNTYSNFKNLEDY